MLAFYVFVVAVAAAVVLLVVFGSGRNRVQGDGAFGLDWFRVPFDQAVPFRRIRRSAWGRPRRV